VPGHQLRSPGDRAQGIDLIRAAVNGVVTFFDNGGK
jgi:hypothetical protein